MWGALGVLVLCSAAPISFHCLLEVSQGSGCMAPISQPRKGQRPQVGLAMASLTAATAECGHLSRTVPGGSAAEGWPAEGSRELQRLSEVGAGWDPSLSSPCCSRHHQTAPAFSSLHRPDLGLCETLVPTVGQGKGGGWGLTCLPLISGGATAQLTGLHSHGASMD